jgi:tRNA-uridine 2-sulfurtransferase
VRDVARRHGLVTAEKPESQEICFVPAGDYRAALRTRAGWQEQAGPLIDADGTAVGEHRGAAAYTVGQRQGLGVALGSPRYVRSIDAQANVVTLGRREDLYRAEFGLDKVSFVAGQPPADEFRTSVRIRHRAAPAPGTVRASTETEWSVTLDDAAWAPAPGQAAVFYAGDEVVGGGRIAAG